MLGFGLIVGSAFDSFDGRRLLKPCWVRLSRSQLSDAVHEGLCSHINAFC